MSHDYIPLLIKAIWPLTTIFLILWFRTPLRKLIVSISGIDLRSGVVSFGQAPSDTEIENESKSRRSETVELVEPKAKAGVTLSDEKAGKWNNSANLFWLGSDLEWTSQTLLRGAPKVKILHGLRHSEHHTSELGLLNSGPGRELRVLKSEVQNLAESEMSREWRINFSEKIHAVVRGFDGIVKEHQPDFKPPMP